MNRIDQLKSYKETRIKTANQGKLIVMLYDGAIKYLNLALDSMDETDKHYDEISNNIIKVQDIVTELMVSLDFERGGEISKNLFSLYVFMNRQLLEANVRKSINPLGEVKALLLELRSAWAEVSERRDLESRTGQGGGVNIAG
ncbi:MAG TPA: flagellar export chaperone FliS [Spirochaetales bacterium]|nr:flagellar export chaperone FliS [Spirochaetales bacterium]